MIAFWLFSKANNAQYEEVIKKNREFVFGEKTRPCGQFCFITFIFLIIFFFAVIVRDTTFWFGFSGTFSPKFIFFENSMRLPLVSRKSNHFCDANLSLGQKRLKIGYLKETSLSLYDGFRYIGQ